MKQELIIAPNVKKSLDYEKLIDKVRTVCDKVEKTQDLYKTIAEETYIIHKNKLYKDTGQKFEEYMRDKCHMGRSTAFALVQIWDTMLSLEATADDPAAFRKSYMELPMRKLLELSSKKPALISAAPETVEKALTVADSVTLERGRRKKVESDTDTAETNESNVGQDITAISDFEVAELTSSIIKQQLIEVMHLLDRYEDTDFENACRPVHRMSITIQRIN